MNKNNYPFFEKIDHVTHRIDKSFLRQ